MRPLFWIRKSAAAATLAATATTFVASGQMDVVKLLLAKADPVPLAELRLRFASTETYERFIREAIAEEDFDDARQLVALAVENGRTIPPDLVAAASPDPLTSAWIGTRDFASGAVTGEVNGIASLTGALVSDYLMIGDIRDVTIQATRLVSGEDYDGLILGLATIGLLTLAPGTGGIDLGVSLLKNAKRTGRISKPVQRQLTRITTDLIDTAALKRAMSPADIGSGNIALMRRNLAGAVRPGALAELQTVARNTGELVGTAGIKATFNTMKHVDDVATDLPRFARLARHMGDRTSAVVRMLGKAAIRLGDLVYHIAAALLAIIGWFAGLLWTLLSLIRNAWRLVSFRR